MKTFDLNKQAERVNFVLAKRNLPDMRASVGITLDVSGSTEDLYRAGAFQRVVEQIIPVGLRFDDNGNLDVYTFSSGSMISQVEGATKDNYVGFVKREILDNDDVDKWSGTDYSHVTLKMLEDYGFLSETKSGGFLGIGASTKKTLKAASASGEAVINYFITDGLPDADDKAAMYNLLKDVQNSNCNIYFMFVGVGRADFTYLQKLADDFGNVGFLRVADLEKFVDSDDIYEQLLPEELTTWLRPKK